MTVKDLILRLEDFPSAAEVYFEVLDENPDQLAVLGITSRTEDGGERQVIISLVEKHTLSEVHE